MLLLIEVILLVSFGRLYYSVNSNWHCDS